MLVIVFIDIARRSVYDFDRAIDRIMLDCEYRLVNEYYTCLRFFNEIEENFANSNRVIAMSTRRFETIMAFPNMR